MDTFLATLDLKDWAWLLGPPIVAGGIGYCVALHSAQTTSVTKMALLTTWGLGIILGFFVGVVDTFVNPHREYAALLPIVTAIVQVPISYIAGIVVAMVCGIRINARDSGRSMR